MIIRFARLCVLIVLAAAAVPLYAVYCVPPSPAPQLPFPDPTSPSCGPGTNSAAGGSCGTCDICSKSPGYLASGTYVNTFTDLQIPTAGMYPLSVFRRYDSGRPVDGPLGVGWTSSLTAHLYFAAYLFSTNTYSYEADVIMPSGLQYRFTMSGNSFVAPPGKFRHIGEERGRHVFVDTATHALDVPLQHRRLDRLADRRLRKRHRIYL